MNYSELCESILEDYGRYWILNIPSEYNPIKQINFYAYMILPFMIVPYWFRVVERE